MHKYEIVLKSGLRVKADISSILGPTATAQQKRKYADIIYTLEEPLVIKFSAVRDYKITKETAESEFEALVLFGKLRDLINNALCDKFGFSYWVEFLYYKIPHESWSKDWTRVPHYSEAEFEFKQIS